MKKRFLATALSLIVAASAITACNAGDASSKSGGSDDVIVIGALGPLTGDVSVYGIPVNNGIKMAIDEINANGGVLGKQIKLVSEDNKSKAEEAISGYNKLKDTEKMVALLGDVTSGNSKTVAIRANGDKIPMLTPSATAKDVTEVGEYIFRACFIDPFQGKVMADYASNKLGAKTAAILYNVDDDYSKGLSEGFEAAAKDLGLEIVAKEAYNKGDVDFKTQLTNINSKNADVFFVPVYAEDLALIARQAKSAGISAQLIGGDGWDGVLTKIEGNEDALSGAVFCSGFSPVNSDAKVKTFVDKYTELYKTAPASFAALAYDSTYMMVEAIKNAGSTDSAKIVEELKKIEFDGVTGHTKFGEDRNPVKPVIISTFEGKDYKFVETYEIKD